MNVALAFVLHMFIRMNDTKRMWKYVTDAASSNFAFRTPQEAFDGAVAAGDWWRGAEKKGGTISIRCSDGASFLDADELDAMKAALR